MNRPPNNWRVTGIDVEKVAEKNENKKKREWQEKKNFERGEGFVIKVWLVGEESPPNVKKHKKYRREEEKPEERGKKRKREDSGGKTQRRKDEEKRKIEREVIR